MKNKIKRVFSAIKWGNVLEYVSYIISIIEVAYLGTMKKKNINTRKEHEKKAQREKDAKKKAQLQNLPQKGQKR